MNVIDCAQGSEEWLRARLGSLGASRLHEAIARTKTGYGASRANLMAELIAERLTGEPAEKFTNAAMAWGTEKEPEARSAYEFLRDMDVEQVGLVKHPVLEWSHASPDGLVGDDGLVEIKCPNTATHLDTLIEGARSIPAKYLTQMQWQMACCDRAWCDFCSYDPRLPEPMRLFVHRISRDDLAIAKLEREAADFLTELEAKLATLRKLYGRGELVNILAAG